MSLYKVILPNPYVPFGEFIEDGDDGMAEKINVKTAPDGRLVPLGAYGVAVPMHLVRPFTLRIMGKRGFDYEGAWKTLHRSPGG